MKRNSLHKLIIFDHDGTLVDTTKSPFHLFSEIKELLKELIDLGFSLSVWTARGHRSTVESLKANDVLEFFTDIYGHDDGPTKPHPLGLKNLSDGFEKEDVLHIGDSLGDVEGALHFGIEVIYAQWNQTSHNEHLSKNGVYFAKSIFECKKIIENKYKIKFKN